MRQAWVFGLQLPTRINEITVRCTNNEALQKLLEDERREDLADKPLKWQMALRNLVAQLLAQPAWIIK
jgi:hypothetical protein